ncbi:ribonucleases P/MRP protein subunit POP1 [Bombina bombina]|uniref:ribonucleases P/MRP protein subunit POP1 n=1 Tax=Bombina bombina TaxID=8345 RepID=UPI00235AA8C3|nr:ribonucleases P/MRP protein subunit POP1 [Bombina bombina]
MMSSAKEKKYAKRMRHQPSNVSFPSNFGEDQRERPRHNEGRASGHPHRDGQSGPSVQHQRPHYQSIKGRGGHSDAPQIPKYITATMFAQARAAEISAMVKAVSQKSSNSLVFQSLPRHMRRRAMGHDIKRLPRRLREIAKKEMEKSVHQKKEQSKAKCRKARRRHGNIQMEFNRRQRKNIWLETHIWHAKRFHMIKKWGYCLADRPTMKSYRACYRAMTSHCLLQDLSYLCCLELIGKEEDLLKALSRLTSTDTGPSFAAVPCLSGKRQGSLVVYRADKYPEESLGPVTFIWKPKCSLETYETRQLWIWVHPALKQDILKELRYVCLCDEIPDTEVCQPNPDLEPALQPVERKESLKAGRRKRKRQDKEGEQAVPVKRIIGDGTRGSVEPYIWTSKDSSIIIRDLTMEMVRYRLIGPLSHCVLTEALRSAPIHKEIEGTDAGPHGWWADYCRDSENLNIHNRQTSMFQLLQAIESPSQIPSGTVLGLTLGDPRLNLPKKRTKAMPDLKNYEDREKVKAMTLEGVPVDCAQSLIWSSDIRSNATEKKISEQEINRLKSELLVPGSQLDLGNNESKIPVLLIQQPGKVTGAHRIRWGSGWDICLPKGWGMAFWIPFIYRGVRVGGRLQELQHSQYMGAPYSPNDFPDCPAGVLSGKEMEKSLLDKYKRRPPAKRTNFIKHSIVAPFLCPWEQLTAEWEADAKADPVLSIYKGKEVDEPEREEAESSEVKNVESEDTTLETCLSVNKDNEQAQEIKPETRMTHFSVLRNKRILKQLSSWCLPTKQYGQRGQQASSSALVIDVVKPILDGFPRSLVWVRISMLLKGSPELHALICIPTRQDLQQLKEVKSFSGPQENKHSDPFKKKVLKLKKDKKKEKLKIKKSGAEKNESNVEISQDDDLTLGLWPNPLPKVTTHCSRVLLGFVTHGNFSMAVGCGEALGFVSLTGLIHMLSCQSTDQRGLVLLRDPSSLQYRFAKLFIDT